MTRKDFLAQQKAALKYYKKAHIALTAEEIANIEVADFGKNMVNSLGLQLITYINTERVCAKEMVLLPGQTCPDIASSFVETVEWWLKDNNDKSPQEITEYFLTITRQFL